MVIFKNDKIKSDYWENQTWFIDFPLLGHLAMLLSKKMFFYFCFFKFGY